MMRTGLKWLAGIAGALLLLLIFQAWRSGAGLLELALSWC